MQPTKEQWMLVGDALRPAFGSAVLWVDGYELSLYNGQVGESRLAIVPYVNGWNRGEWLTKDCEERRRFMRPRKSFLWPQKERKRLKRMRKRTLRDMGLDPDAAVTSYSPCWPTFGPLRRHLQRENENIVIVTINGKPIHVAPEA